jgi:hypothetical protein
MTSPVSQVPVQALPAAAPGQGQRAAATATRTCGTVSLPALGTIELPPTEDLAFVGGLGLLAVAGILEWPVVATLAVGHLFAGNRRNRVIRAFGQALEEA